MKTAQPVEITDVNLLKEWIAKSGLKIAYIIDQLGISRAAWDQKIKGAIPFRKSEVYAISSILGMTDEVSTKIFCPKG